VWSIYYEIEQAEVVRGCTREREEERNWNEAAGCPTATESVENAVGVCGSGEKN
jgi:predicted Fe-S protein YdhL (DUF1289 family)